MAKKIIQIDEEKCVGCGLCANACKQSAIEMVNGKARVMHKNSCDGIGNCLPVCPVGAISFSDVDVTNVIEEKEDIKKPTFSCPGKMAKMIQRPVTQESLQPERNENNQSCSQLMQWPVQIKLVPPNAPYFENAKLLVAADCTAFSYANFHSDFMKNKVTIVGCPKLDVGDYTEKLTEIIASNNIKSVTVVRMEVPCCGGIELAVKNALINSKKMIPWQVVTISTDGRVLES